MVRRSPPGLSSKEPAVPLAELSALTGVPAAALRALARACRVPIRRGPARVSILRWADISRALDFQRLALLRAEALGRAADPPARRTVADDALLLSQWHAAQNGALFPYQLSDRAYRKVFWKCPVAHDHEWRASVVSRFRDGHGCPMCQNRRVSISNSLAVRYPEIAREWHPARNGSQRPDRTVAGSTLATWWKCPVADDHEWQMPVYLRTSRGAGCPFCSNRRLSSTNNLLSCSAALAAEWHPTRNGTLRPSGVVATSRTKVWWKCPEGPDHEWLAPVMERFNRGIGCPMCASKRVSVTNSLAHRHPNLAEEWHPTKNGTLRPVDVVAGTDRKVWWKCPEGPDHEWQADISSRTRKWKRPAGCPFCTGQRPSAQTSLAARYPEIAREWHPTMNGALTPDLVTYGSKRRVFWQCPKVIYHVWEARVYARTTQRGGCRYCAGFGPPEYRESGL